VAAPAFPTTPSDDSVATWAELYVLQTDANLTVGDIRQAAQRESAASDSLLEGAWRLIEERSDLHGANWPLVLQDGVLSISPTVPDHVRTLHAFLCALSLGGEISLADRRLFEHCVTELAPAFSGGPSIRMGATRIAPIPVPFGLAVDYYGELSQCPHVAIREYPHDQDLGMDVATWMVFADGRGDYLHFIGQCATGANWDEKLDEPVILRWRDRVQWASDPVRFFALPFVIRTEDWRRVCQSTPLVLDRPRLVELAHRGGLPPERVEALNQYLAAYE
jgi:hypothetical protein